MPGFIDIVSFPTSDGALHQVYANVHEETDAKLSLEFETPFLRNLLLSLRSRREEKMRRIGQRPFDVTLGVFNHPAVDGDSMGLAFAITEHIASFFASKPQRDDGSLELDGLPRIIATGDIAEDGAVRAVEGMDAKLAGVLAAIGTGAELSQGIFVFPAASKTPSIAQLTRDLEAVGWTSIAINHIDDAIAIWQTAPQKHQARPIVWNRWKLPLKWGSRVVALVMLAVFWIVTRSEDMTADEAVITNFEPKQPEPTSQSSSTVSCTELSGSELASCIVILQTREGTD